MDTDLPTRWRKLERIAYQNKKHLLDPGTIRVKVLGKLSIKFIEDLNLLRSGMSKFDSNYFLDRLSHLEVFEIIRKVLSLIALASRIVQVVNTAYLHARRNLHKLQQMPLVLRVLMLNQGVCQVEVRGQLVARNVSQPRCEMLEGAAAHAKVYLIEQLSLVPEH